MVYSFDIFDTCLYRSCGKPKYVFDLLALHVLKKDKLDEDVTYFSLIRSEGEITARKNKIDCEITIADIYKYCDFSNLTSISNDRIMEMEMEIENDVLYSNPIIKEEINTLQSKGYTICFISDMYLSSDFLKKILIREGLFKNNDILFVSSEVGLTKSSGKLYDFVLSELKIKPYQLKHKGDNLRSDFLVPLKKGIFASFYHKKLSFFEKVLLSINTSPIFDYNYISSNISCGIITDFKNPAEIFAADFIAPIMIPYVYHILLDAKNRGIQKIFFLSRDGYIPYVIAKEFSCQFPELDIKYLFVSRRSLYFPSLQSFDLENKENILTLFSSFKISQTIDYLHLDNILDEFDKYENSKDLISFLFKSGKYEDVEKNRIEQNKLILKYFIQEGLANNNYDTAIVDVRGTLRTQNSINKILVSNGYKSTFGYYFEVQENRLLNLKSSNFDSILDRERYTQIKSYKDFNKASDILEQYFCITDQKRTQSYIQTNYGKIEPYFESNKFEDYKKKKCLMHINIEICKQYANLFKTSGLNYINPKYLIYSMIYIFSIFMRQPRKPYINALNNVIASQNRNEYKYIVSNMSIRNVFKRRIQWYEGSMAKNFGNLGLIIYRVCNRVLKILK